MKNVLTIALAATASIMIAFAASMAPVQAASADNVDTITTGSTEKPIKDGKKLYPVNALSGLNF